MKDALTTNTLGEKGYGELRALSPRPQGFVKSSRSRRNKAQTERITCQAYGLSTIFMPARTEISSSFMGKGLAGKRDHRLSHLQHFIDLNFVYELAKAAA